MGFKNTQEDAKKLGALFAEIIEKKQGLSERFMTGMVISIMAWWQRLLKA